jgi:hypothetical protein
MFYAVKFAANRIWKALASCRQVAAVNRDREEGPLWHDMARLLCSM